MRNIAELRKAQLQKSAELVKAAMRQYQAQITDYAIPMALTKTAMDARDDIRRAMPQVFDRPTPFTMASVGVVRATRSNPVALVGMKEFAHKGTPAPEYLLPQVEGGPRRLKRLERSLQSAGLLPRGLYVVPGQAAELDSYGNMRRGQLTKILSYLRASSDPMQNRSASGRNRGRRRNEAYFVARPDNHAKLPPGIYKRDGGAPHPVVIFVRPPTYRPRFPLHQIVERSIRANMRRRFAEAMTYVNGRFARKAAGS